MAKTVSSTRYLIVGNSAGGIGAAEAIRSRDSSGAVTILSEEPYLAYSRPLISDYLAGHRSEETILFRDSRFYVENNVECVLGTRAVRIDARIHTVELNDGRTIEWEKLLLATGGTPIRPPLPGADLDGVFTFTTLDDAKAVKQMVTPGSTVVVVGGGLIGLSVGQALRRCHAKVVIVELQERLLSAALDKRASHLVDRMLRQVGITVITGRTVGEIVASPDQRERAGGVILDDGRRIDCQAVIVAIGVRPRADLTVDIGLNVHRGIVVDRHMETSCPDVYACGDVAEAYDPLRGENRPNPIWPNAYMGGRIAGLNMATPPDSPRAEYEGGINVNSFNYFGLAAVSAGIVQPPTGVGYKVLRSQCDGFYRQVVLQDNVVVGMVSVGDIRNSGIIYGLIRDGTHVRGLQDALVSEDFSIASLPASLRHELLERPEVIGPRTETGRNP